MTVLVAYARTITTGRKDPAPASATVPVTAECGEVWAFHMDAMAARRIGAAWEGDSWNAA